MPHAYAMAGVKRLNDGTEVNSQKRKHVTLTILKKVEIIKQLEAGSSINNLAYEFGISSRTIYDIKKIKTKYSAFTQIQIPMLVLQAEKP